MANWHPDTRNERVRLVLLNVRECTPDEAEGPPIRELQACNSLVKICVNYYTVRPHARVNYNMVRNKLVLQVNNTEVSVYMPTKIAKIVPRAAKDEVGVLLIDASILIYSVKLAVSQEVEALLAGVKAESSQVQRLLTTLGDGRLEKRVFSWLC